MATIKPTSVPSKRLAASITAASSSIQLNNILGWDGVALTASDFGTKLYAVLRNDSNTLMEIMELDPSTIASASITVLRRGLKFTGDLTTEVTANKLTWIKNETIVEIGTDSPQLLNHYVDIVNDQTVGGVKTFSSLPATTGGNPVSANDLARKAYVDSVVAGIATTVNVVVPGTAGETVAAGQLVYFDDTDNEWKLCDADTAATVENVMLGIAQGAGTNGNSISGGVLVRGLDANQSGLTAGAIYYASNTAGGLSASAGTKEVTIGFAYSATQIYFNPRFDQQLTEDQQDALAGNNGTPSGSNKFTTQSGNQINAEKYAADAGANDTYVITLSPVPAAYVTGMVIHFKANTANTGAATINVNSLGAKTIVKYVNTTLADGDIAAGMYCTIIYDGTNFVLQNPIANLPNTTYASGVFQQNANSTTTTTIAHGLGKTPKMFRIHGLGATGASNAFVSSHGSFDGTNNRSIHKWHDTNGGTNGTNTDTTAAIWISYASSSGSGQTLYIKGVVTWDSTNITITWTNGGAGNSSLTISYEWEAEG